MADKAPSLAKFVVVPGLVLTNVLLLCLLAANVRGWTSDPSMADFVVSNRAAIGILVQVLSHLLGLVLVTTACTILNLSSRLSLAQNPLTLGRVKLLSALCGMRVDWSLPWAHLLPLLFYIAVCLVPAALWAGAITPIISSRNSTMQIDGPSFSNLRGYDAVVTDNGTYTKNTARGIFTFLPEFNLQGLLLNSAQDASNRIQGTSFHNKIDKTGYVYAGRSYGMGVSVGLTDLLPPSVQGYTFSESGVRANTHCIYNRSSAYIVETISASSSDLIGIYNTAGWLPNGAYSVHAAVGLADDQVTGMAAAANAAGNFVALVTASGDEGKYGRLNQVQCQVDFEPMQFAVNVNVTNQTITVHPQQQQELSGPPWPATVMDNSIRIIDTLGGVLSSTIWVSVLGDVFLNNIGNVEAKQGKSDASNLQGVGEALSSIVDNTLVAYSSAQLMVMDDSRAVDVEASSVAVRFGSLTYIWGLLAINTLVTLAYALEVLRTRGWRQLSTFDYMDVSNLVVAASGGGTGIADQARSLLKTSAGVSQVLANIRVRLNRQSPNGLVLELTDHELLLGQPSSTLLLSKRSSSVSPAANTLELSVMPKSMLTSTYSRDV